MVILQPFPFIRDFPLLTWINTLMLDRNNCTSTGSIPISYNRHLSKPRTWHCCKEGRTNKRSISEKHRRHHKGIGKNLFRKLHARDLIHTQKHQWKAQVRRLESYSFPQSFNFITLLSGLKIKRAEMALACKSRLLLFIHAFFIQLCKLSYSKRLLLLFLQLQMSAFNDCSVPRAESVFHIFQHQVILRRIVLVQTTCFSSAMTAQSSWKSFFFFFLVWVGVFKKNILGT